MLNIFVTYIVLNSYRKNSHLNLRFLFFFNFTEKTKKLGHTRRGQID